MPIQFNKKPIVLILVYKAAMYFEGFVYYIQIFKYLLLIIYKIIRNVQKIQNA